MKPVKAFSIFAFATILGTGAALAQAYPVQATMPFNFTVGAEQLPAGTYRIIPVRAGLVAIENRATQVAILCEVFSDSEQPAKHAQLIFYRYGDQYFLHEVLGGPAAVNVSLPVTKAEEKARHPENLMAHNQSQVSIAAEGY